MSKNLELMIFQIKNGINAGLKSVTFNNVIAKSNLCKTVLNILECEGYIRGFSCIITKHNKIVLKVFLKYKLTGQSVISNFSIVSKSSCRVYSSVKSLWDVKTGFGVFIVSTKNGVMTINDACYKNLGGEILCYVV